MNILYSDKATLIIDEFSEYEINNVEIELYDYNLNIKFDYDSFIYSSELYMRYITSMTFRFEIIINELKILTLFTNINIFNDFLPKMGVTIVSPDIQEIDIKPYIRKNKINKIIENVKRNKRI